ncbi:NAD-dependent epimerase/dehydratase family protein [Actinomadura sp. KC345]|uniref:SDR family oxidoreductase n=1 Tax=Actinomadura sp. KC345 TaxID=2530371 RepID=UPI0010471A46|nr:NAD(P)H-binding protein [Actinomadura sp. KC345]TDC45731.1 NAD-dependent epimerase/dehydratase family protein [Actinomadura sp. KC345]
MILVTGASGTLGRPLTRLLAEAGADVHGLSRRAREPEDGVTWHKGDLSTGEGVDAALEGAETVVHCASDPFHTRRDLPAAKRLIEAARRRGAPHLIYISIVGVDKIPYSYYRTKYAVERLVERSGLPYTILRTTQFHTLPDMVFNVLTKVPGVVALPKGLRDQPIDVGEVAERLARLALAGDPARRVDDMGGPEVLTAEEMVRTYLEARGLRRPVRVPLPLPGRAGRGFRDGHHLTPGNAVGKRTWRQFLDERHART